MLSSVVFVAICFCCVFAADNCTTYRPPVLVGEESTTCTGIYPTYNSSTQSTYDLQTILYNQFLDYTYEYPQPTNLPYDSYQCSKAIASLFCSNMYPRCNSSSANGTVQNSLACSSYCLSVIDACNTSYAQYWNNTQNEQDPYSHTEYPFKFPTVEMCLNSTLYSSDGAHCTNLTNSETNILFYYNNDSSSESQLNNTNTTTPTKKPTKKKKSIVYPPKGPGAGAGLGIGILALVMGMMGGLMFIMKKQDQR